MVRANNVSKSSWRVKRLSAQGTAGPRHWAGISPPGEKRARCRIPAPDVVYGQDTCSDGAFSPPAQRRPESASTPGSAEPLRRAAAARPKWLVTPLARGRDCFRHHDSLGDAAASSRLARARAAAGESSTAAALLSSRKSISQIVSPSSLITARLTGSASIDASPSAN
jgi:hypothetical protein